MKVKQTRIGGDEVSTVQHPSGHFETVVFPGGRSTAMDPMITKTRQETDIVHQFAEDILKQVSRSRQG